MDQSKLSDKNMPAAHEGDISFSAHVTWMRQAIELAKEAAKLDETPVGALIVKDGKVIGRGFNLREMEQDVTMHAEMIAIREASRNLGSWRLEDCTLYVTIEPCIMCAGAIVQARLAQIVFGAFDPKAGAAGSIVDIFSLRQNHQVEVTGGIEAIDCAGIVKEFFADLRRRDKASGSRAARRRKAVSDYEETTDTQK